MHHGESYHQIVFRQFDWIEDHAKKFETRKELREAQKKFKDSLNLPDTKFKTEAQARLVWDGLTEFQRTHSLVSEITPIYNLF